MAASQPIDISSSRSNPYGSPTSSVGSMSIHPYPVMGSFGHQGSIGSMGGGAASFGSRFYPSSSPSQVFNALDPNEFRCRVQTSFEWNHDTLVRAMNGDITLREDEICRDYACCGRLLQNLHALLDHFEDEHVIVVDPDTGLVSRIDFSPSSRSHLYGDYPLSTGAVPIPRAEESSLAGALGTPVRPRMELKSPDFNSNAFDPEDMEMDMGSDSASSAMSPVPQLQHSNSSSVVSSASSTPPDTPLASTPISIFSPQSLEYAYSQHSLNTWGSSEPSLVDSPVATNASVFSHHYPSGLSAFENTMIHAPSKRPHHSAVSHPYARKKHSLVSYAARLDSRSVDTTYLGRAFNGYAGYSDYSSNLPGTIRSGNGNSGIHSDRSRANAEDRDENSIPPSLLFSPYSSSSSESAATPEPTPAHSRAASPQMMPQPQVTIPSGGEPGPSTTLSRPASSLLLSKPFRCPTPGCLKSYKQANGLKYHITHGSCSFSPPAELATVEGLSEREAERKLRPYCCQVPPCQRRYKNMNGLRYHYQHTGDHGAIGLALLASGNHDATKSPVQDPRDTPTLSPVAAPAAQPPTSFAPSNMSCYDQSSSRPASAYASPWASPQPKPSGYSTTSGIPQNSAATVSYAPLSATPHHPWPPASASTPTLTQSSVLGLSGF